ncbi:MAG: hypothetical protein H6662_03620 [Ardenticatenaceae bacterium]|nr:hypothetical protein [Anaerolineales bacterium]MCB8920651.1 hypothetical protein [Ardenticatenaceae bacterium]MCB9002933.1 hypothetical protein [Ardenticatenaceae bacterium]
MGNKIIGYSKARVFLIIAIGFLPILFVYKSFQPVSSLPSDDQCIASFDTFAFTFPDVNGPKQDVILPLSPWEVVAVSPEVENLPKNHIGKKLEVIAVRQNGDDLEIWVSNPSSDEDFIYLVYLVNTQEWTQVSPEVESKFAPLESLHISNGNSVWKISILNGEIVFSVFNDDSKHFVEQHVVAIPSEWGLNMKSRTNNVFDNIQTMWDVNDIFWIFSSDDAIYSFDLVDLQLNRFTSLEGYVGIGDLVYDLEDRVFFDVYSGKQGVWQYDLFTDYLAILPLSNMPVSTVSLVDSEGNLWLRNSYGWRTAQGKWQRFYPKPISYWWHFDFLDDWVYYLPPNPVQQTSDGRIWFVIYRSEEWKTLRSGIAWYDPNTQEGCWFTSEGAQIVEDSQQNLWVMIENILYKYSP